jgi:hypothetical protein
MDRRHGAVCHPVRRPFCFFSALKKENRKGNNTERKPLTQSFGHSRGVLRQAMAIDGLQPAGVYFGTNTGHLYASADEGDEWVCVAENMPPIYSVETLSVNA